MAEVPFRPVRQLSKYKGKGASASREKINLWQLSNFSTGMAESRDHLHHHI